MKSPVVQCPMCHGYGGYTEPVLDYGEGPWFDCGFCKGTGKMKKGKLFYQCLGWISAEKRRNRSWRKKLLNNNFLSLSKENQISLK